MVLPDRIELSTSPLPRECSTTELVQRRSERQRFIRVRTTPGKSLSTPRLTPVRSFAIHVAMDKPPRPQPPQSTGKPGGTAREIRLAREAAALRANLLKRKQQSREREKPKPD